MGAKVLIELLRALLLRWRHRHEPHDRHRDDHHYPDPLCEDDGGTAPFVVPDVLAPRALVAPLAIHLAGAPAAGSVRAEPAGAAGAHPRRVIWVDEGDEVVVHLDSVEVQVAGDAVVIAIDLEAAETGRATLVVPFALGSAGADKDGHGGLVIVTEDAPRGPAQLVARWGTIVQDALYASLLALSEAHALERGGRPVGLYVKDGNLHLDASPPAT